MLCERCGTEMRIAQSEVKVRQEEGANPLAVQVMHLRCQNPACEQAGGGPTLETVISGQ